MMKHISILLPLILALLCHSAYGTESGNEYRKYDVRSGLSNNSVKSIRQDRNGYVWLATKDGLNRFNSKDFEAFRSSASGHGLNIDDICEHISRNEIWMASTEGLFVFDAVRDSTYSVEPGGIHIQNCNCLCYDRDSSLWIGCNNGLYRFNERTGEIRHYGFCSDPGRSPIRIVKSLLVDETGNIYAGMENGLVRYIPEIDGFDEPCRLRQGICLNGDNSVTAMLQVSHRQILAGTQNGLIGVFDTRNNTFTESIVRDKDGKAMSLSRIHSIFKKSSTEILFGTDSGLFIYYPATRTWARAKGPLGTESVYTFCEDREKGLWIGTYFYGASYQSAIQSKITWFLPGYAVSELCEDRSGNLWIATENGGLHYFDTRSSSLMDKGIKTHDNIHALMLDGDRLWIGTFSKGLDCLDIKTGKIRNFSNIPSDTTSICNDYVYSILKSKDGRIFVGTMSGLSILDENTGRFSRVKELEEMFIGDLAEDSEGNIWAPTRDHGIFRLSAQDGKWKGFRPINGIPDLPAGLRYTRVHIGESGAIWFCGERDGITRYDPVTEKFTNYGSLQGLPDSMYYGVLEDGSGNIWLSSNIGIVRYNPTTHYVSTYTAEDGLQSSQFNYRSSLRTSDGTMYFGGVNGFNGFNPFDLPKNTVRPGTVISSVEVYDIIPGSKTMTKRKVHPTERIRLPYNAASFDINVDCLSFSSPDHNSFSWQMKGLNNSWITTNSSKVSFARLSPGKYTFQARGRNNNGYWSKDIASLTISIDPPLYLTVWAKILYLLGFLSIIYGVGTLMHKRQLEKRQKEMNDEKMVFFTQVAHEIKTPLSLVKSPMEDILDRKKWDEDTETDLEIMKKNIDRLLELVCQLLDFRKIDSGDVVLSSENLDLKAVVTDIVDRFRKKGAVQITVNSPERPLVGRLSTDAISKIIGNLLENSLKFASSSICVNLDEFRNDGKDMFRMEVWNDGPGIQPEFKKKIFEPFFQATDGKKGFGIGLSLVKLLVDKLDGRVYVSDSESGCGMVVEIPVILADDEASRQEETEGGNSTTILVVEDSTEIREYLVRNLRQTFSVLSAGNGVEALETLAQNSCDVVISDIMMPEMDGYELLQKIREDAMLCHIPVIMLSALDSTDSKIKAMRCGADAFIEKPFSISYIKATVNGLIENRKALYLHFASDPGATIEGENIKNDDSEWISNLNAIIRENLTNEDFSVDQLAKEMAVSRSSLQRKLKGLLGATPNDYIKLIRLKTAAQMLQSGSYRINEVCYMVGFSSLSYFTRCFTSQFGIRPKDYINKQ